MKIDIMRGKGHKRYVLSVNDRRVGMKDGYGYSILETFEVPDDKLSDFSLAAYKDEPN